MVSNSGFHWFHCSKQEVESFLLVFKAKQNLIQDLYTLEILPLIQKFEKNVLVKGLMTKFDTMLISILVDLQGAKRRVSSFHLYLFQPRQLVAN